jgi:hypothetical protein
MPANLGLEGPARPDGAACKCPADPSRRGGRVSNRAALECGLRGTVTWVRIHPLRHHFHNPAPTTALTFWRAPSTCDAGPDGGVYVEAPEDIFSRYPTVRGNAAGMARLCAVAAEEGAMRRPRSRWAWPRSGMRPTTMVIRDIVHQSLSTGVPAYHWRMLRDEPRNAIYARAIARHVRAGMTVLEIGTGAGLLALMAARAGARVVTCESNPMIAAAARRDCPVQRGCRTGSP